MLISLIAGNNILESNWARKAKGIQTQSVIIYLNLLKRKTFVIIYIPQVNQSNEIERCQGKDFYFKYFNWQSLRQISSQLIPGVFVFVVKYFLLSNSKNNFLKLTSFLPN